MSNFSALRPSFTQFPAVGRLTRALALTTAAAGLAAFTLAAPSYADSSKYGPNLRTILSRDLGPQVGQPGVKDANTVTVIIRASSDISGKLRSLGVNVRTVVNNGSALITADVPVSVLPQVASLPEVQGIDAPVQAGPAPATAAAPAAVTVADATTKYGPSLRNLLTQDSTTRSGQPGVLDANTLSVIIRARSDVTSQLQALGVKVRSSVDGGKLITADVPVGVLPRVAQIPDVTGIDTPVQAAPTVHTAPSTPGAGAQPAPRVNVSNASVSRVHAVGQARIQGDQITVQTFRGQVTFTLTGQTTVRGHGQNFGAANGHLVVVVGRNEGGRIVATDVVIR